MPHLTIRNWSSLQHYKDRSAPWIKLYRDLLTSESWVLGSDLSRTVQVASMLLATRYNNEIPLNFALLRKVMSLDCTEAQFMAAVDHLVHTDFLSVEGLTEQCTHDASGVLATCTSEERRGEENREEERPRKRGSRLAEDWKPDEEEREYAKARGLNPDVVAEKFRNYWHAKAGKDACKLDWRATWRNWCITESERLPRGAAQPQPKRERPPTPEEIARARAEAASANATVRGLVPNLRAMP